MSVGGVGPTGGAGGVQGSWNPQHAMNDFLNGLEQVKEGKAMPPSMEDDIKTIANNPSSFNPPLNASFQEDLLDFKNSGGKGLLSGMISGSLPSSYPLPFNNQSVYASSILSEYAGDDGAQLSKEMTDDMNKIIAAVNSGKTPSQDLQVDLQKSFLSLGLLNPPGLSKSFSEDLSDFLNRGVNGDGLIVKMFIGKLPSSSYPVPFNNQAVFLSSIMSEYAGDDGAQLKNEMLADLQKLMDTKYPSDYLFNDLEKTALSLGLLNPSGLSKDFSADLSDFLNRGVNGDGLIAKLFISSGSSSSQASTYAKEILAEYENNS